MATLSTAEIAAAIDSLLQEHERFDLVQLLDSLDLLDALRESNAADTLATMRLRCPRPEAEALIHQANTYADALGLLRRYPARSAALVQAMSTLRPAAYGLEELLRQVRERPQGRPQLDLFQDNRLLHIEARLRSALTENRLADAEAQLAELPTHVTGAATRSAWQRLIAAPQDQASGPAQRLKTLEEELPALARHRLGAAASSYLRRLWGQLAVDLTGQAFQPDQPHLHASHAWRMAREWSQVCQSVEAETHWRAEPLLIQRLIEAHQHLGALQRSRRLWLQLCWQHPDAAETALNDERADAPLNAHWQQFLDAEPVLEVVDFPAWLLLVDASQTRWLPPDDLPAGPRATYCALQAVIESGGAMEARRTLHGLHPDLLKHYLLRSKKRG